jgi:hypothetical protein
MAEYETCQSLQGSQYWFTCNASVEVSHCSQKVGFVSLEADLLTNTFFFLSKIAVITVLFTSIFHWFYEAMTVLYSTQNHRVSLLCPSSGVLKSIKHKL